MSKESLNDLSMKPTRDDLAHRQVKGGQAKGGRSRSQQVDAAAGLPDQVNRVLWLMLLLIVVAAGAVSWTLWEEITGLRQQLAASSQQLNASRDHMDSLKDTLDTRSSVLNLTGDSLKNRLQVQEQETRKLWDLANKTNKASLKKQAQSLSALQEEQTKLAKVQQQVLAQLKEVQQSLDKTLKSLSAEVAAVREESKEDELQASLTKDQLAELDGKLDGLQTSLSGQKKALAKLKSARSNVNRKQLIEIEKRLDAIDTYRRQVNGRLDKLDRDLNKLYRG